MSASKLSINPKYGQPSAKKLNERFEGFHAWANGMKLLRTIHIEEREALNQRAQADLRLDRVNKWNA